MSTLRDLFRRLFRGGAKAGGAGDGAESRRDSDPAEARALGRGEGEAATVKPEAGAGGTRARVGGSREIRKVEPPKRQPIVVGIDFGTSGTKVAFRDFADRGRIPTLIDFGTEIHGYSRFSLPSILRIADGQTLVGAEAEAGDNAADDVLRAPKMGLLRPGGRLWPVSVDGAQPPPIEELASALVIAEAVRQAKKAISSALGETDPPLLFNLDIPVGEAGERDIEARFRRVLSVALQFADELGRNPDPMTAVVAWTEFTSRGETVGELIPEAQAVMQGVSQLARLAKDDKHAVFDVGAGTVDMGIFKIVHIQTGDRVAFWGAETPPTGCDGIDLHLMESLGLPEEQLPTLRSAKVDLLRTNQAQAVGGRVLEPGHLEAAAAWLHEECRQPYTELFRQAFTKQRNTGEWSDLKTFVVGGGSLISSLVDSLVRLPGEHPREFITVEKVSIEDRMRCRVIGASGEPPARDEIPFLIPAVGLSHMKTEMPDAVLPGDISDDPGPERGPTGLYDFEVGDT